MIGKCKDCGFCKWCAKNAHWLLRLSFGAVFLYHGILKFQDIAGFAKMMGSSTALAGAVAFAEVAGGAGAIVGGLLCKKGDLITRLAGLAITPVMLGAIFMVHWPIWNNGAGGMEFPVTLLAIALFFLFTGNGCCKDKC
ncbi:MAG: DoxX family protein [Candidatus Peregrinibacteria bacterium]|nr:DoxX family protein [Candidatus Peregrinibacteria bacterium]